VVKNTTPILDSSKGHFENPPTITTYPIHHGNKLNYRSEDPAHVKTLIILLSKANLGAVANSPKLYVMTFELDYYQQILSSLTANMPHHLDEEHLHDDIKAEAARIKQKIDSYAPKEIHDQKTNIHYQLGCLSRFSLKVETALASTLDSSNAILDLLLENTEEIVHHILQHFLSQFDFGIRITKKRIKEYLKTNEARIDRLLESLENQKVDSSLIAIIKNIIALDTNKDTTLFQLTFALDIMLEIEQLEHDNRSAWQIAEILIARHYNHEQFYKYLITHLNIEQRKATSIGEKYRMLSQFKKNISQIIEHKNLAYCNHLPDIRVTIMTAIEAELDFMKEMDFLNAELINSGLLESTYKIGISVKQLAFLIFLCMDCGIITEKRAKSVHQYIISHVTTKEKEQISEKSFSNGYYVHLPEDIRKVSELLAKMLALAQKLY
jgi:hypothetical protein